jgi:hypothetical protein
MPAMTTTTAAGTHADVDPPYQGDMVTVARRFNSLEAELLRGRLAADGIPATLGDAHTVQTDTLLTTALGGVRIRVPTSFEAQALRTIADLEAGALELMDDDEAALAEEPPADESPLLSPAQRARLRHVAFGAVLVFAALELLRALAR